MIDLYELDINADVEKVFPAIMKHGSPGQKRYLAEFTTLSPEQHKQLLDAADSQDYYLENFHFDICDKHYLDNSESSFFYESTYPLKVDPALDAAGVTISARVTFSAGNSVNNIVFKRDKSEQIVSCVHTAVCNLPADRLAEMMSRLEENPGEYAIPVEEQQVKLPPEEHFVALNSYVDGIAQTGIANMLNASYYSEKLNPETLPFGFNSAMQKQILTVLKQLAPDATRSMIVNHIVRLFDEVPADWIESRMKFLDDIYNFKELFLENFEAFEAIYSKTPSRSLEEWALTYRNTHGSILPYIATGGKERNWPFLFPGSRSSQVMADILPLGDEQGNRIIGKRWEVIAAIVTKDYLPLPFRHFILTHAQWFIEQGPIEESDETFNLFVQLLSQSELPAAIVDPFIAVISLSWKKIFEESLRNRLRNPSEDVQLAALSDPLLAVPAFAYLRKDALNNSSKRMRLALLSRTACPAWVALELVRDPDEDVQLASLLSPQLPIELGKEFVRTSSQRVKLGLFHRPNRPGWLLEWLARDNDEEVQFSALIDPWLPQDIGIDAIKNANKRLKLALLNTQKRPVWVVAQLTRDADEDVQITALAELPSQNPTDQDKTTVHGASKHVKLDLLTRINRPRWIVELLSQDPDQEVQLIALSRMPR
ncbi:MAG TPA: hypothetical protein VKK79_01370 [Candidatus Lokiarchaeia archaeon]|nr:hypothetical protein [Candidatus Lokiarchaeia archaeon]